MLAWAWSLSLGVSSTPGGAVASSEDLATQLERWSSVASPGWVEVRFSHAPGVVERDWLSALSRAGTRVRWSAESIPPTATAITALADPAGGAELAMAAPGGASLVLRDTIGVRDSMRASAQPLRVHLPRVEPGTEAVSGGARARDQLRDSLLLRRILLLGRAGWETRFLAAALTERGWIVDARFVVAPGSDVLQGIAGSRRAAPAPVIATPQQAMGMQFPGRMQPAQPPQPLPSAQPAAPPPVLRLTIDTARYSAVIIVDSTAARDAGAIARYLRDGGGVILWPDALTEPAFRAMAAGGLGTPVERDDQPIRDSLPRTQLALVPLLPLHPDAIPLEQRGGAVAVAARRIGAGRVLQVGYRDVWNWPMEGDSLAPEAYRAWVAGLVARVALVGRVSRAPEATDPAPLSGLIDRLGPATPPSGTTGEASSVLPGWLLALLCLLFLLEWASRRTRGVP